MGKSNFVKGHCYGCGVDRADLITAHEVRSDNSDYSEFTEYQILECRGCGNIYFKSTSSNSEIYHQYYDHEIEEDVVEYIENIEIWPPGAKRQMPRWTGDISLRDRILGSLLNDVYTALSINLNVLAAIGMRTVFDRASELLAVDPNKPFYQKLNELKDGGHITEKEKAVLGFLIDAGSAAAHRGWEPEPKQLDAMMIILEAFLHRSFLLAEIGAELGKGVPKRHSSKN